MSLVCERAGMHCAGRGFRCFLLAPSPFVSVPPCLVVGFHQSMGRSGRGGPGLVDVHGFGLRLGALHVFPGFGQDSGRLAQTPPPHLLPHGAVVPLSHGVEEVPVLGLVAELARGVRCLVVKTTQQSVKPLLARHERVRDFHGRVGRAEARCHVHRVLDAKGAATRLHDERSAARVHQVTHVLDERVHHRMQRDGVEDRLLHVRASNLDRGSTDLDPRMDIVRAFDPAVLEEHHQRVHVVLERVPAEVADRPERGEHRCAERHVVGSWVVGARACCGEQRQQIPNAPRNLDCPIAERLVRLYVALLTSPSGTDADVGKGDVVEPLVPIASTDLSAIESATPDPVVAERGELSMHLAGEVDQFAVDANDAAPDLVWPAPVIIRVGLVVRAALEHGGQVVARDAREPSRFPSRNASHFFDEQPRDRRVRREFLRPVYGTGRALELTRRPQTALSVFVRAEHVAHACFVRRCPAGPHCCHLSFSSRPLPGTVYFCIPQRLENRKGLLKELQTLTG
jgi:hypothetical protein